MKNNDFIELNKECCIHNTKGIIDYESEYFENYKERSYSEIGVKLNNFRRCYVECFSTDGEIIDVGTGYGQLVMDSNIRWFGYDVNPLTKNRLGKRFDEKWELYNNICFFDVLEHFKCPNTILNKIKPNAMVFITIPVWNHDWSKFKNEIISWKHWRPNEHFLYTSTIGFITLMNNNGFDLIDNNQIETSLGRQEVHTFAFRKKQNNI